MSNEPRTISSDDWKRELATMRKRRLVQDAKRKAVVEKALQDKQMSIECDVVLIDGKLPDLSGFGMVFKGVTYRGTPEWLSANRDGVSAHVRMHLTEYRKPC